MNLRAVLTIAIAGVLASSVSVAAEKTLMERHGSAWPQSADGFATKTQCLKCHGGTYEELGKKTASLAPNPHYTHLGEVNCVECHKGGSSRPALMCDSCHRFTVKKKM